MAVAAVAAIAVAVTGDFETESHGAKMGDFAEKFNRRLGVVVLKFALGGAHAAQTLNVAGGALGGALTLLAQAGLGEKLFPAVSDAAFANVEGFLLGENADTHLAVRIDGERGLDAATKIERVVGLERRWVG